MNNKAYMQQSPHSLSELKKKNDPQSGFHMTSIGAHMSKRKPLIKDIASE